MIKYTINGRQVACEPDSKSRVCKAVSKVTSNASYNDSRLSKLQDEFFCRITSTKYMTEKDLQKYESNIYKCGTSLAKQIGQELDDAARSAGDLARLTRGDVINTYQIRHQAIQSKLHLDVLDMTIGKDKNFADSIFEDALYDTNSMGIAAIFSILIPPLGLAAFAANSMYNNHVDGKVDRAVDGCKDILAGVIELEGLGY